MLRKWDELRNAGKDEAREGKRNLVTGQTIKSIWTNRPAIDRAIASIHIAMAEAEVLRSEPLPDAEMERRLDLLRQGIPPIGEWVQSEIKATEFTDEQYAVRRNRIATIFQ